MYENERRRQHHAGAERLFPPEPLHRVSSKEGPNDLPNRIAHRETSLPGRGDDIGVLIQVAEVTLEGRGGEELTDELGVESLGVNILVSLLINRHDCQILWESTVMTTPNEKKTLHPTALG